ncbi:MAG: hypothetical protein Q8P18_15900 [Pseudomonadota bacterium]|nr:hypothetical protein [Pseudomonadota bacterium]
MSDPAALAAILARTAGPAADPATIAWAHEGKGDLSALPDPHLAIAAAAALGNSRALLSVTGPKELKKAAAAALHKLKSRGVKIEEAPAPRAFVLGKGEEPLPARAFLSLPDMTGDMELLLTTSDAGGNCALGVILSAGRAKQTQHGHLARAELRDVWKQATARGDLVEIPYIVGLHYAERFLATGEHKHDWTHFLEHVPSALLQSARVLDPLANPPAAVDEGEDPNPRWMAPLGVLDNAALNHGINQMPVVVASAEDDAARDAGLAALYTETADNALEAGDRAALARSADLTAVALTFHGRPLGAAIVRAQGEAALAGAPGSAIEGVAMSVRLLLITQTQQRIQDRVAEINREGLEGAALEGAE